MKMMAYVASAALALMSWTALGADTPDTRETLRTIFPEEVEIALALSGGPEHLRAGATVYVYRADGFAKVRAGNNGFTCLVNRDAFFYGAKAFKPTCWDAEGATSYVPVMLRVGQLLAAGKSTADIRADIDTGFRDGRFHRPARTGIAYMLVGDVNLDLATGQISKTQFPGHSMIYAPGVANTDIGFSAEAKESGLPFIFAAGAGGKELGYLIAAPHH